MSNNLISPEDALNLLNKLIAESIVVVAYFVAPDKSDCRLRGFVLGSGDGAVFIGSEAKEPDSFLTVSFAARFSCLYRETREISDGEYRERLNMDHGESALSFVFESGSRLSLFFTL
jgi:hypothetical protein